MYAFDQCLVFLLFDLSCGSGCKLFQANPKKKDDAGDTVDTTMEVSTMSPSPAALRTRVGVVATNLETRDGMDSIVALAIRNKSKQNNK